MKFTGKVIKGAGRGKELGFPTANLDIHVDLEDGIYIGQTKIPNSSQPPLWKRGGVPSLLQREGKGEFFPALVFVGAAETFGDQEKKLEVYILDFDDDLYGQKLTVDILKKLRGNIKFESREELIEQMKRDEAAARKHFQRFPSPGVGGR